MSNIRKLTSARFLIVVMTILLFVPVTIHSKDQRLIKYCSLKQIITTPKRCDNKLVRLEGFASIRFEGNALYLSKKDYETTNTKNAVWLDIKDFPKEREKDQTYVLVEGRFDEKDRGHLGLFVGCLKDITKLETQSKHNYVPKEGYVPNAATAIKIAEAVWLPIYGDHINAKKPFKAQLKDGMWYVRGTLPHIMPGGVPEAVIDKQTGEIMRLSHGK